MMKHVNSDYLFNQFVWGIFRRRFGKALTIIMGRFFQQKNVKTYLPGREKLWPRVQNVESWARILWAKERLKEPERGPDWARLSQSEPECAIVR